MKIQAELNSGDSEKENENTRRDKTYFFTYLGKFLHPGPKKTMIALSKKEHNWAFESGRRKCELKGIKNTFPGIAMDVLILLEGYVTSSWRDMYSSSHPCLSLA